ncbi:MAG: penicillin acylase family protein [Pseudomonadota bacterium]
MRIFKWAIIVLAACAAVVAFWLFDPLPSHPSASSLSRAAEDYDVEIVRDEWGVPHIYGKRDADTALGLAYAHAEDDFETIQETVAATRGVLARYRGPRAAPTDYVVALMGVWSTIDTRYDVDVPDDVKALAEGYAAGLNLYASQNLDATWRGLAPFTAQDVVAGYMFKTPFFYGLDAALGELFSNDRDVALALDPQAANGAWIFGPKPAYARGSNAFAVSPERSGDGTTRLLINSHQPMTGPVAWYEAHLVSDDGLDITGGLFPGAPMIVHGFTPNLGWANTVNKPDLIDVYRLTKNPAKSDEYRFDGGWVAFEREYALIDVKLWGPFVYTARRPVLRSVHGPVVDTAQGAYAFAFAGDGEIRQLEQFYRLNQATDFDGFMDALALQALPSLNYVYADKTGRIAFVHNAQYPNRPDGWDWSKDLPGDRADLVWDGYRPFTDVPKLVDPPSGLVFNANNAPFSATDGSENLAPSDFSDSFGLQTNMTNRALRILELADPDAPLGRDALLDMKFDTAYSAQSVAAGVVDAILAEDWTDDPNLAEAARHLADWDFATGTGNRHAALGVLSAMGAVTEPFTGIPPGPPADAFRETVAYLRTHYGRIDPTWGEVNRLVRGEVDLPVDGAPDVLRAIYPHELRDDGALHANAGDTWIALVEWGSDGQIAADVIHQFGSATLDESSPHYADQAPLFAEKRFRKARLDEAAIRGAGRAYRPQDR